MYSFENIKGQKINREFESLLVYTKNIALVMSQKVGWLNSDFPINMTGFPGYHLEVSESRISLMHGTKTLSAVILKNNATLLVKSYSDHFKDRGLEDFCMKVSDLCLSKGNISALSKFTHGGIEIVGCLRFNDRIYAPLMDNPVARRELVDIHGSVIFADMETYKLCCLQYLYDNLRNYVDTYPEMIYYRFNGLQLVEAGIQHKNDEWMSFISDCSKIRDELNESVGLEPGIFLYKDAVYPAKTLMDISTSISLATNFSAESIGRIFYKGNTFNLIAPDKSQNKCFAGKSEAISYIRDCVFSHKNIAKAKKEAELYKTEHVHKNKKTSSSKK